MNPLSPIVSASLSPNTEGNDVENAFMALFTPWLWRSGNSITKVEQWFAKRFGTECAVSFNSGRSAQLAILKAFDIGSGDEVLVQAFTCVAVPNSVMWAGAKPVYVDIDESLNIDVKDAEKKLTKKTKAIIVQHTLGIPAQMDRLVKFAKEHKLILIEDCAHSLGATHNGKTVGTFGDAAFFSFGRDKVLSSVFGGMATVNEKYKTQSEKLKQYQKSLEHPPAFWIVRQLLHPIAFAFILPFYNVGFGKLVLVILQKLNLLSFPVYKEEKTGHKPSDFPKKYPNALAKLLLVQLAKLDRYNRMRQTTADLYAKVLAGNKEVELASAPAGSVYLRYPIFVDDPQSLIKKAKSHGILLGNWYHNTIDPDGVDFDAIGYTKGSCPNAEKKAGRSVNLPTRISIEDAKRVARII